MKFNLKKHFLFPLLIIASFSIGNISPAICNISTENNNKQKVIKKLNNINELWGEKLQDYYSRDYSAKENSKVIGKYYKVGIMGHRQCVNYGQIKLLTAEIEQFISSRSVEAFKDIKFEETTSYTIINQVSASVKTKIGIVDMVNATLKFEDIATVGTNTNETKEYEFAIQTFYGKTFEKTYKITSQINTNVIPSDKKTFSLSRVSCFLECEVKSSYTEEQNLFGKWSKLNSTVKENYICRYYIADVTTFCYNDNTFGDTSMGIYKLNILKEY